MICKKESFYLQTSLGWPKEPGKGRRKGRQEGRQLQDEQRRAWMGCKGRGGGYFDLHSQRYGQALEGEQDGWQQGWLPGSKQGGQGEQEGQE